MCDLKLLRQRTLSVQRHLVEEEGFKENLFRIQGYGFLKPYVAGWDEQNRRMEIVITYPKKIK